MPQLIIVTGLPTSGKSTRARQLHAYLAERIAGLAGSGSGAGSAPRYRLHLISDQTQSIGREVYDLSPEKLPAHTRSANASEKDARAALYGAVKRVLSPCDIVVLDGLNYIKGWRYQLFCEAKNLSTPHAVLQVGCTPDRARGVNEARLDRRQEREGRTAGGPDAAAEAGGVPREKGSPEEEDPEAEAPYEPSNWENLVFRYEEPNPMTRWDSPLFTLIWEDDEAQTRAVFDSLWDAVVGEGRKTVKPNRVTTQRGKDAGGDYLYVLDRETQEVVKRILEQQGEDGGGEVRVPSGAHAAAEQLVVELPAGKNVGLPQLQRLRRAFLSLNRGGIGLEGADTLGVSRIRESFVGYLNDIFEKDE